ncbi:unnamed protein product, partial [Lymnaea stagnalis]
IRIISNPAIAVSSPSGSQASQANPSAVGEAFTPPLTPNNQPLLTVPSSVPQGDQSVIHVLHQAGKLRNVLTSTAASLPPSHSCSTSPFKVVIPSSKQATTYLLKVPPSKFSKTATM